MAELDHIRQLLDCVEIGQVYSVDDRHAPGPDLVINIGRELSLEQRAELLDRAGDDSLAEDDFFAEHVERVWGQYGRAEQTALVSKAQEMAGDRQVVDDQVALDELSRLLGDRYRACSRAEWEAERAAVLGGESPVLILFDRDFRPEGGGATEGEDLIREVQQTTPGAPVWTGLLTHTVTPEEEHDTYLTLGDRGIDLHRMVVISKRRVTANEFPAHLRLVLLAPLMHRLVSRVAAKITETHETALAEAKRVLPVELESMMFGASDVEGVWPPDTLLLLFGLIQRDAARERVWDDDEVRELTRKVRCLSGVEVGQPVADRQSEEALTGLAYGTEASLGTHRAPRYYQRRQIYAEVDMVNKLHLPIECGDIFRDVTATSKLWVVIGQPCDLVVRRHGKRGAFPIDHVVMAPIKKITDGNQSQAGDFLLPYFEETGRHAVAQLHRARHQRLWLLDLAVFDDEGTACIDVAQEEPPAGLLDGWGVRYIQLRQDADKLLRIARQSRTGLETQLKLDPPVPPAAIEDLSNEVRHAIGTDHANPPFTTSLDSAGGGVLSAGCQRIGRLTDEYARALLTRWGAHLSRPVLPYDLTRHER